MKTGCLIWTLLLTAFLAHGQKTVSVVIHGDKSSNSLVDSSVQISEFADSIDLRNHLEAMQKKDFSDGYLYASYAWLRPWSDTLPSVAYLRGRRVYLSHFTAGNADELMLRNVGITERKRHRMVVPDPAQIAEWKYEIITYYENNGYPFASVALDIDSLKNDRMSAAWRVEKGPLIVFDSIVHKGRYQPSDLFASTWLGIESGKPYNESRLRLARSRIALSELVEEEKPFQVQFSDGKSKLFLFLKKKKSNRFDGILGFAPDQNSPGKLLFNGDVNLRLVNTFNHGDLLSLKWKSSANSSQEISVKASVPYLFGLPVGVEGLLDIYRRDTLYVKTRQRYGIALFSGVSVKTSFFAENTDNRVIDQTIYENAVTLPVWADSRSTAGGISLELPLVDHLVLPLKGIWVEAEAVAGRKTLLKNSAAPDSLYAGLDLNSAIFKSTSSVSLFIPVKGALRIMSAARAGWLETDLIFDNDLYLLGGLSTLRGFDEKSLAVSRYLITTIESRLFLERFSYLALFTEYAAVKQSRNGQWSNAYYLSTGVGLSFSTNAGVFSLYYALGKSNPGSFSFRNGKVHFGFVTRF